MKHITLSTSRLQYFPSSGLTHPCKSITLTGEEAVNEVKSRFSRKLKHLRDIYMGSGHPLSERKAAEEEYHNITERLKALDENDLKVTVLHPEKEWLT